MNLNRWIIVVLAIAGLSALSVSVFDRTVGAQDKKAPGAKKPAAGPDNGPFSGKVLLVQKKYDQSPQVINSLQAELGMQGFVLTEATITNIAGIRFLAGFGIERVDEKPVGPRVLLPVDDVGAILEFESLEVFKEYEEQQMEKIRAQGVAEEMELLLPQPNGLVPPELPDA
jgi:hypothetical protein